LWSNEGSFYRAIDFVNSRLCLLKHFQHLQVPIRWPCRHWMGVKDNPLHTKLLPINLNKKRDRWITHHIIWRSFFDIEFDSDRSSHERLRVDLGVPPIAHVLISFPTSAPLHHLRVVRLTRV